MVHMGRPDSTVKTTGIWGPSPQIRDAEAIRKREETVRVQHAPETPIILVIESSQVK